MTCTICNDTQGEIIVATDFASKNRFNYWHCYNCGVAYLNEFPDNYEQYYFTNYYSLKNSNSKTILNKAKFLRNQYQLFNKGVIGNLLYYVNPNYNIASLKLLNLKQSNSLLDVGCGIGNEVLFLQKSGFKNVTGIDPFISSDIYYNNIKVVEKKDIFNVNGNFDFITMHHSFEHVFEPLKVLLKLRSILSRTGILMIRIPVKDSYAFEKFGVKWVQFDAPRHTFLHTKKSMAILCEQANLQIDDIIYDSNSFQFWGSDIAKNEISVQTISKATIIKYKIKSIFKRYQVKATKLNAVGKGDQAIFLIKAK